MRADRVYEVFDMRRGSGREFGPIACIRAEGGLFIYGVNHGRQVPPSEDDDEFEELSPGRYVFHFHEGVVVLDELTLSRFNEVARAWLGGPKFYDDEDMHRYWVRRIMEAPQ